MSQNDLSIANQGFASFRSDLNSALQALGSTNSGTSAPSTTYANQLFYDTTNNILKIRNEDNDAFISLFTLDQANDNIESLTINGALTADSLAVDNITIDGTEIDLSSGDFTLDVAGDIILDADDGIVAFRDGGVGHLQISNSSNDAVLTSLQNDKDLIFQGNDNGSIIEAMRIDMSAGGNVGIGATPSTKFHVKAGTNQNFNVFGPNVFSTGVTLGATTDGFGAFAEMEQRATQFVFHNGTTERMRIDSNGDVGIGSTTPGGLRLFVTKAQSTGSNVVQFTNTTSSGNVFCVGTSINSNGNNTSSFHVRSVTQGVLTAGLLGNGTQTFTSDERLKKNIETTRDGYLEDLAKLRVVKYNWHNHEEGTPKELGLIAQEVEKVFPNLIRTDDDLDLNGVTDPKSLKASVIPMMLLKGLQEATKRIETLEAEVKTLKGE